MRGAGDRPGRGAGPSHAAGQRLARGAGRGSPDRYSRRACSARVGRDAVSAVIRRRPDDLIDPRSRDIHRLGPASTDRPRKARYLRAARTALATGGQAQRSCQQSATGSRTPCQRGHNDDVRFVRPGAFAGDAAPHAGGSMATASIEMSRGSRAASADATKVSAIDYRSRHRGCLARLPGQRPRVGWRRRAW